MTKILSGVDRIELSRHDREVCAGFLEAKLIILGAYLRFALGEWLHAPYSARVIGVEQEHGASVASMRRGIPQVFA
jgi:hypothetical protein